MERNWPIKEIQLQAKRKGAQVDDFIVVTEEPNGNRKAKLFAQVKHKVTVSNAASNTVFAEVIQAAWRDFNNAKVFTKGEDALVMISRHLSGAEISGSQDMLDWAKDRPTAQEFFTDIGMTKLGNASKQTKLAVFREQLKTANNGVAVSDKETHEFLKHFHFIGFDLDMRASVNASLLHSHISQYPVPTIEGIWGQIFTEVGRFNKNAGTIAWDSLPKTITDCFSAPRSTTRAPGFQQQPQVPKLTTEQKQALVVMSIIGAFDENNVGDKQALRRLLGLE